MPIRVYNSLSRRKEDFQPWNDKRVGMYVCGPTVYMNSHIGHGVGPVIFDTIKRYLVFRGYDVTMAINITDVDDKLIVRAKEENTTVEELARKVEADYMRNIRRLGVVNVDHFPRATEYIEEIVRFVKKLIELGHAYEANGDVYFDVASFSGYGKLSGRNPEEMMAGARIAPGEHKRAPADFALWKASKPGEPAWDSPWGRGRPGWHIECSAMSMRLLGEQVDIHGGAHDLVFPHHENEIAQSESFTGRPFVKYWMHNGLMQLAGAKMSKSTGNLVAMTDLLAKHPPELIRFLLLSTHYRRPIDFGEEHLKEVNRGLQAFYRFFDRFRRATGESVYDVAASSPLHPGEGKAKENAEDPLSAAARRMRDDFTRSMDDDFNTAGAIAAMFEALPAANRFLDEQGVEEGKALSAEARVSIEGFVAALRGLGGLLGIFETAPESAPSIDEALAKRLADIVEGLRGEIDVPSPLPTDGEALIELLIALRASSRKAKKFNTADAIRNRLAESGIVLEDRPTGTTWSKATG